MRKEVKLFRLIALFLYIVFIFRMTLIGRTVHPDYLFYGLFWELRNQMWGDIIKNIVLFVPFGFIIGGKKGVAAGFLLSCGIEITQYFIRLGYCELDDVLNNTIGALIGVGIRNCLLLLYQLTLESLLYLIHDNVDFTPF